MGRCSVSATTRRARPEVNWPLVSGAARARCDPSSTSLSSPPASGVRRAAVGCASSRAAASRHDRPAMLSTARTARSRAVGDEASIRVITVRAVSSTSRASVGRGDVGAQHARRPDRHGRCAPPRAAAGRARSRSLRGGPRPARSPRAPARGTASVQSRCRQSGQCDAWRRRRRCVSAIALNRVAPCATVRAPARRGRRNGRTALAA